MTNMKTGKHLIGYSKFIPKPRRLTQVRRSSRISVSTDRDDISTLSVLLCSGNQLGKLRQSAEVLGFQLLFLVHK